MGTQSQATAGAGIVYTRPAIGVSAAPVQMERRASRRYPIDLSTWYEVYNPGAPSVSGSARVVNISSGGLLLYSEHPFEKGQKIRLRIDWPALLNNVVPLALRVEGQTVRCEGNCTAVKILKSEFRTRAAGRTVAPGQPGPAPVRQN